MTGCTNSYISILFKTLNTFRNRLSADQLKITEEATLLKKEDQLNKENYCRVSLLSLASSSFERMVFNQIYVYFKSLLSPHLIRFCKNHITLKESGNKFLMWAERLVLYLWICRRRSDPLNDKLLLVKLNAYGFFCQCNQIIQS